MKRLTKRLQREEGITIVTAVALMGVVMAAGLATYSQVDTQSSQARQERVRESTFNLAEAALNTQAFKLSRRWPASSGRAFVPAATGTTPTCSSSSAPADFCPQPVDLAQGYDSADYAAGRAWKTWVRDDFGTPTSAFFDWAQVRVRPSWDANGNGIVFVRAASTVRGKTRALAAQVQIERVVETLNFPERTVIAGSFRTDNNGNKVIVDTKSTATSPHPVTVRCTNITNDDNCMDYRRNTTPPQISPAGSVTGGEYVGQPAIPVEMTDRLREAALANGTYYTSCPSLAQLTGAVVWVQATGCGNYNSNATVNSSSAPGILVVNDGVLTLNGGLEFHGVIYHLNASNSCTTRVNLGGTVEVYGRIFIDGCGKLDARVEQGEPDLRRFQERHVAVPDLRYGWDRSELLARDPGRG